MGIKLGRDLRTSRSFYVPRSSFNTHWHMIGGTGTGKTTALITMLIGLLRDSRRRACLFVIDRMGGLTLSLQRWIASERFCPEHVRRRYVCIEPAREEYVLPFNPLPSRSEANEYYQVEQAVDAVLRAWDSQDVSVMPRLRRWSFNAFLAAARLGYPIACCQYLLQPGSDEHKGFLRQLPQDLRYEWAEILNSRGQEAIRILESTRNRLGPFFDSCILRRTFGSSRNHFDVKRFIDNRNIVLINVSPGEDQLPGHLGRTFGSLAFNQILKAARSMSSTGRPATDVFVVLDEFQEFVGPDVMDAIPILRQMGFKLVLANQSFSQLIKGDLDLNGIIWQARSRMIFANDSDDADRLAHECATLTWDEDAVKHRLVTRKQRIAGHERVWLTGRSDSEASGDTWNEKQGYSNNRSVATNRELRSERDTVGSGSDQSKSSGGSRTVSRSTSGSESLVPIHEDVDEVSSVTFQSFDEFLRIKAREIRLLRTGQPLIKLVNNPNVYHVAVDRPLIPDTKHLQKSLAALSERNLNSGLFLPASEIDREAEELRQRLLRPPTIDGGRMGGSHPTVDGEDAKRDTTNDGYPFDEE